MLSTSIPPREPVVWVPAPAFGQCQHHEPAPIPVAQLTRGDKIAHLTVLKVAGPFLLEPSDPPTTEFYDITLLCGCGSQVTWTTARTVARLPAFTCGIKLRRVSFLVPPPFRGEPSPPAFTLEKSRCPIWPVGHGKTVESVAS